MLGLLSDLHCDAVFSSSLSINYLGPNRICSYQFLASDCASLAKGGKVTLDSKKRMPKWTRISHNRSLHKEVKKSNLAAYTKEGPHASSTHNTCNCCVVNTVVIWASSKRTSPAAAQQLPLHFIPHTSISISTPAITPQEQQEH